MHHSCVAVCRGAGGSRPRIKAGVPGGAAPWRGYVSWPTDSADGIHREQRIGNQAVVTLDDLDAMRHPGRRVGHWAGESDSLLEPVDSSEGFWRSRKRRRATKCSGRMVSGSKQDSYSQPPVETSRTICGVLQLGSMTIKRWIPRIVTDKTYSSSGGRM